MMNDHRFDEKLYYKRTRFKGRQRVQIQLWLTAAAMNIKRAVRDSRRKGRPAAPALLLYRFVEALGKALVSRPGTPASKPWAPAQTIVSPPMSQSR